MIARLIKALLYLVALAAVGVIGYAYIGDLGPVQSEVRQPVKLDAAD